MLDDNDEFDHDDGHNFLLNLVRERCAKAIGAMPWYRNQLNVAKYGTPSAKAHFRPINPLHDLESTFKLWGNVIDNILITEGLLPRKE